MLRDYEQEISRLSKRCEKMDWRNKRVYGDYLAQTYYYVSYSTRLLALAAGNMKLEDGVFFKRFLKHIAEESSHEKLAEKDLKNLGFGLDDFSELSATKMFYESQFYKVEHIDPLALMGYILPLEAIAVHEGPKTKNIIESEFGGDCVSFIKLHGEEDPEHITNALKVIKELPAHRVVAVEVNLKQTIDCMISIFDSIEDRQAGVAYKVSA